MSNNRKPPAEGVQGGRKDEVAIRASRSKPSKHSAHRLAGNRLKHGRRKAKCSSRDTRGIISPTEQRKQLRDEGYLPVPVKGKRPPLNGWQTKTEVTDTEIEGWSRGYLAEAKSTGLLTRIMPTFDIDILNEEASEAVEALVRERFEERGKILVRIGVAPKRAIPFRTDTPFKKTTVNLTAPNGRSGQKLELLADGQQVVAFGVHEDTLKPYTWHGGEPGQTKREELPEVSEAEAQRLVDDAVKLLCDDFGYTVAVAKKKVNGASAAEDWNGLLKNIHAGHDLHDSIRDFSAKLVVAGANPGAVVNLARAMMQISPAPRDARWQERYDDISRAVSTAQETLENTEKITVTPHSFPSDRAIPKWDFLYGTHLLRRTVSGTAAMGSTGKSSKAIGEALAMTSGRPLLGVSVPRPLRVLLINLEDNRNATDKRIAAAMQHHNLKPEDIGERLFTLAKGEIKFKVARQVKGTFEVNRKFVDVLVAFMLEHHIDVVSIDPFISTHGVNENDNAAIREVVECYDEVAERGDCAVSLWHHTRKGNGLGVSVDSARGASSFVDTCRSVRVLETMTAEEAQKHKIQVHRSYFREFSGKLNFAPPTDQSDCFRFVNVQINNGETTLFRGDGDNVGVVEVWEHPATKEVELSPENVAAIKLKLSEAIWREDARASMWAGKAIAPILRLDPSDDKAQLRKIISKLIRDGILKAISGRKEDRKPCLYVVPADWTAPVVKL